MMLAPCQGHRRRASVPSVALALCSLAGCAPGQAGNNSGGAWGFVALALLLVAGVAYLLGTQRRRAASDQALRQARNEQRQWAALAGRGQAWVWQTDAEHRLLSWQGPGLPPQRQCTLFDDAALAAQLRGQQPFADLRLQAGQALDGSHAWALRGVPGQDDLGRFNGYLGSARPTDVDDSLQADAAALQPLLALHNTPALVARQQGGGWTLQNGNAAAQALWPQLGADTHHDGGWSVVAATLPPAVLQATAALGGSTASNSQAALQLDGWSLCSLAGLPVGQQALLLVRLQQAVDPAAVAAPGSDTTHTTHTTTDADAAAQTAESDNFSFTVSHDLRAPIRVVEGFTRIVKEDYGRLLDRVGNDHLDRVLGAAARMNLMIDALLQLARLSQQPLTRQPVNLSQLAGYVVDDLRRASPERDCTVDVENGLTTQGDPTLLRLVLENLLGNAWKYSGRNPRSQISLRSEQQDGRLAYVVRDNGAGFDMRSADRLFGLFQRLHSASEFPGHGVGLASVRRIVRRHGGDIWAEAEPGRGAAFFFTLRG